MAKTTFIERINSQGIPSNVLNTGNPIYQALIGQNPFYPTITIVESSDFRCGALCNELEFSNLTVNYFVDSMMLADAGGNELDTLIDSFIDLPRLGSIESDESYRTRFQAIVTENTWPTRTTPWAIINALSYYAPIEDIRIIEWFGQKAYPYFQVRITGTTTTTNTAFYDSNFFYDNSYYGGVGVGVTSSFLYSIIERIKAAGVSFDIFLVVTPSQTIAINATVGTANYSYRLFLDNFFFDGNYFYA